MVERGWADGVIGPSLPLSPSLGTHFVKYVGGFSFWVNLCPGIHMVRPAVTKGLFLCLHCLIAETSCKTPLWLRSTLPLLWFVLGAGGVADHCCSGAEAAPQQRLLRVLWAGLLARLFMWNGVTDL